MNDEQIARQIATQLVGLSVGDAVVADGRVGTVVYANPIAVIVRHMGNTTAHYFAEDVERLL